MAETSVRNVSINFGPGHPAAHGVLRVVELKQKFRNSDFTSPWEGTDYVLPGDEKAKQ